MRAALALASVLQSEHSVDDAVFGIHETVALSGEVNNIDVEYSTTRFPMSPKFILELNRAIRMHKPDIVHCLGLYTCMVATFIRQFRCFRLVSTVHRVNPRVRFRMFVRLVAPIIAKHTDQLTFLTEYQRDFYDMRFGYRSDMSVVLPNVVLLGNGPAADRSEYIKDGFRIVFVGRLVASKNVETFIDTVRILISRGCKVSGIIVGGGDYQYVRSLHAYAGEMVGRGIEFVGYRTDPEVYIDCADVILFPTKTEALPNLIVESFARGKAVVCSNIPQLREICNNGNSILVDGYNANDYADKVAKLMSNTLYRQGIENRARETYKTVFETSLVANKYMKVYEDVLK